MMRNFCTRFLLGVCFSCGIFSIIVILDKSGMNANMKPVIMIHEKSPQLREISNNILTQLAPTHPKLFSCNRTANSSSMDFLLTVDFMGQLGNTMFQYAGLLGLAKTNNRTPFVLPNSALTEVFRITKVRALSHPEKWRPLIHEKGFAIYDAKLNCLPPGNLLLSAYLQAYKYFENVKELVRSEYEFLAHINERAEQIIRSMKTDNNQTALKNLTLVGVHVRRSDKIIMSETIKGSRAAPVGYFKRAFDLMRKKYENVRFIVASDDLLWVEKELEADDVKILPGNAASVDLCVLTKCDHVIMSVGTFGWWAGYLSGGDVIYYNYPYTSGSLLYKEFNMTDHFPKEWIGLGG